MAFRSLLALQAGAIVILVLAAAPLAAQQAAVATERQPLNILVADPLAKELACDCVAGFAQRRYEALAMVLEKRLHRPVKSFCGTKLSAYWSDDQSVSLIVGKYSDIVYQAKELGRQVYPIAALTDQNGLTTFRGLFLVRAGNRAQSIADLKDYRMVFGPPSCDEKHSAALAALRKAGIMVSDDDQLETVPSCTDGANQLMKATDQDQVAAVISDYAKVLIEGCQAVPKGALRVIGQTEPLPFVTVFATDEISAQDRKQVREELLAARRFPTLLRLLETKYGFRPFESDTNLDASVGWTDFRGSHRNGLVTGLPATLDRMHILWTAPLEGSGLGGMAVTDRWVLATDRVEETRCDLLKMFDVLSGELRFSGELVAPIGLPTSKNLDYGNSIRTTPVVSDDTVFLLDAFGALYCWQIPDTDVFPASDLIQGSSTALLVDDFELVTWGIASTPLLTENTDGLQRLIVNSCSASHTLLALEPETMTLQWSGTGRGTGYASCIIGKFGGRRQIVGYDSVSLGGWDPETGQRIWTVEPEVEGDFNVPTPVSIDNHRLLVVTESNGMRVYEFDRQGVLARRPEAVNEDVINDTVTPVVVAGRAYCTSDGALYQLDVNNGLQATWEMVDKTFDDHVSLIADPDNKRLLVATYHGELLLFDIAGEKPQLVSRQYAFSPDEREEMYAHPSYAANRLYLRGLRSLKCIAF